MGRTLILSKEEKPAGQANKPPPSLGEGLHLPLVSKAETGHINDFKNQIGSEPLNLENNL